MPPLISLETSSLKSDAALRRPSTGRMVELEFDDAERMDEGNIIRFSGPVIGGMETGEDDAEAAEQEEYFDSKISYYSQLFENSPAAIALLDTYDHVIDLNPAFTKMFQYTLDDIKNYPLTNFIVPKGRMREAIDMTLMTLRGEPVLETLQRKRKDGSLVAVELTAFPVKLAGSGIGIFTIYTDVSQKIATEQRRSGCEKYESVGMLAQGAAHGFNSVLGVLMAGTKQLMHAMPERAAYDTTFLEMNAALDHGVALIGRLLALAGKTGVRPDAANADARLNELAALLQSFAGGAAGQAAQ